jgi:copper chaperone
MTTTTTARERSVSTTTYTVTGMTCDHCVAAVREEVGKIDGVRSVDVDLASGVVAVESESPMDLEAFSAAVAAAGYAVEST